MVLSGECGWQTKEVLSEAGPKPAPSSVEAIVDPIGHADRRPVLVVRKC